MCYGGLSSQYLPPDNCSECLQCSAYSYYVCCYVCIVAAYSHMILYVTGFAKTDRIVTTAEIQFIVQHCSYTQPLSRHTNYKAIDGQVCFHRQPFANSVKP